MNVEAFKRLIDILRNVKREEFDICEFYSKDSECGTVACAAGHAGINPWFRSKGFRLVKTKAGDGVETGRVKYKGATNFDAVAEFFDISKDDAEYYFNSDAHGHSATPKEVAKNLSKYLRKYQNERKAEAKELRKEIKALTQQAEELERQAA